MIPSHKNAQWIIRIPPSVNAFNDQIIVTSPSGRKRRRYRKRPRVKCGRADLLDLKMTKPNYKPNTNPNANPNIEQTLILF